MYTSGVLGPHTWIVTFQKHKWKTLPQHNNHDMIICTDLFTCRDCCLSFLSISVCWYYYLKHFDEVEIYKSYDYSIEKEWKRYKLNYRSSLVFWAISATSDSFRWFMSCHVCLSCLCLSEYFSNMKLKKNIIRCYRHSIQHVFNQVIPFQLHEASIRFTWCNLTGTHWLPTVDVQTMAHDWIKMILSEM